MIAREFFCAVPTGPPPALLCGSKGKMSREKGIFQEKHSPQKKNVPENATKRGGNLSQQQNILILPPNCGGNDHAKNNVLENATKRGETITAEDKCPGNRHKTGERM